MLALGYVAMFSRNGVNSLPIAVCDGDKSGMSRQLIDMINASPTTTVAMQTDNIDQAYKALQKGEINAIVNIAQGLEADILSGQTASVTASINGAYITKMSLITRDLTTVFQAFNIGVQSQILTAKGASELQSYALSYPIVMQRHILFNPFGSYSYYLLPGLLPLILIIIITITTAYVIGSELRYKTAKIWLDTAGGSIMRAVITKIAPYFTLFAILLLFFNTILYRYMGLPMYADNIGVLVLASLLLISSHISLGIIFIAVTANLRFALSISGAVTIASFSFSGLTFPHVAMYEPVAIAAQMLPFTHYIQIFIESCIRGAHVNYVIDDLAILAAITLLGLCFLPMLKKKCLNEKYFGKL